jgi:antitoxin component YwqK of YwqJK toxin-antitoxin module
MQKPAAHIVYSLVIGLLLTLAGCGEPKWNSDYNLSQAMQKGSGKQDSTALASADTTQPDISSSLVKDEVEKKNKKKKKRSRYFLGHKVKKGYTRTGRDERETLELFSYLPNYEEPREYAQEKFVYDVKRKKIGKVRGEIDPEKYKLLHGPYKKMYGDMVIEEGFFYIGTKHLRWEKYKRDGTLADKAHYDQGFLRDAVITYYGGNTNKIKEIIPYAYGEVQGTYYKFYENGQLEWTGNYDKGRKIGKWIQHYDFKNRRHYEFQYPETAYEPQTKPELIREYDRHGTIIFEKGKIDKRSAQRQ